MLVKLVMFETLAEECLLQKQNPPQKKNKPQTQKKKNILRKLFNYVFNNDSDYKSDKFNYIFEKLEDEEIITDDDLTELFKTSGKYINRISEFANELNLKINGNKVTFVKNRNINYTNQCYFKCGFCGFSKGPKSFNLKEKPYSIDIQEVVDRTAEAFEMGASEVCLQGGIHPDYTGEFYLNMVKEIKQTTLKNYT